MLLLLLHVPPPDPADEPLCALVLLCVQRQNVHLAEQNQRCLKETREANYQLRHLHAEFVHLQTDNNKCGLCCPLPALWLGSFEGCLPAAQQLDTVAATMVVVIMTTQG